MSNADKILVALGIIDSFFWFDSQLFVFFGETLV
jgi:hypothetical protein